MGPDGTASAWDCRCIILPSVLLLLCASLSLRCEPFTCSTLRYPTRGNDRTLRPEYRHMAYIQLTY